MRAAFFDMEVTGRLTGIEQGGSPSLWITTQPELWDTPEDDPATKEAAFDATAKKLTRSRKSTVVQLLALAMVRAQQRATAAGKPD